MASGPRAFRIGLLLAVAVHLAVSATMIARSRIGPDQYALLARGWLLVEEGEWVQHGNPTSAGGNTPGGLTSLLVGLPLFAWRDYRAPAALILAFHLGAWLLLDRMLREAAGSRERLLLAVLYGLNPWRIYFSGHVWNPNFLLLFGSIHAFSAWRSRERPGLVPSLFHVGCTGLALQVHPSAVLLVLASVCLFARGYWKPHWGGVTLGALLAGGTLVPWVMAAGSQPDILPGGTGFPLRGLLLVFPVLRGFWYCVRFASLSLASRMVRFDFSPDLGPAADGFLTPLLLALAWGAGSLTVAFPLLAWVRMFRFEWRRFRFERRGISRPRAWLRGYAFWTLAGAVGAFALSPTTVMLWQALPALHAAVLPVVLWGATLLRSRRARTARVVGIAWAGFAVVLCVAMAIGSPMYRSGGRQGAGQVPLADHPVLQDLGVAEADAAVITSAADGWKPDVLRSP